MFDNIGVAEGEGKDESGLGHHMEDTNSIGTRHKPPSHPCTHDGGIQEGFAYGHVPVMGHHSQQEALSDPKSDEEAELGCTPREADGFLQRQNLHQHFGEDDGGVADVDKSQVAEEIVHGGVKVKISPD